jgi:myo-inositol 2-dehydrogenase / D-chiro-inositol 1-dehydrogenase
MKGQKGDTVGRRDFLGAAAATGVLILKPRIVWGAQANSAVRLGLLGCGGRGRNVMGSCSRGTSP